MKIGILASNPNLYSHQRLIEAAESRGHEINFINIRNCYMNISANNPIVHYTGGEDLAGYDAIIPRIRPSLTFYGTAVTRQFEMMGVYCLNESVAISRSRDKLRTLQLLSRKGVPMPTTGFANSPEDTKDLIKIAGGAPVVIKLLEGTQGMGVVLAPTQKAAESVINAFKSLKANILVQEFIKEANGKDLRCFVVGDRIIASMQRTAAEGEFRANVHLGGSVDKVRITPTERKVAVKAAKILGLRCAGVDIVRSASGPKILEVNSSPGLQGIEQATGKDVAGMIIEYLEKNARPNKVKTTGKG
ncbi:MAG: 30S ribosomal protein S6--L-glutamate ligase [Alphaproteobacteria bacterium CG11_big_fil_rev_8_21_14_0_20_44_7]|nr:MAG: 30S ribosomal protein S6--L-glutamate ligase [Alphaproteobacteria bacterium CG11_big_fil_rev_8_21_14_0_20_44_7]